MSFGRLLAAGKSWVGGDGIGRYRMQKHVRLPKFISPQNPFKAESTVEAPMPPVVDRPMAAVNRVAWRARMVAGGRRVAMFCLDHNPFTRIGRAKLPAIPRFGKSGVQGELSLDKVKVMRSDLMHADLEVVTVGPGENQTVSPAWKNLTARVFGSGLK